MNEAFMSLDECLNANYQYDSLRSRLVSHNNKQWINTVKNKVQDLVCIVFGTIINNETNTGKNRTSPRKIRKDKTVKILLDIGASARIVHHSYVHKNNFHKKMPVTSGLLWLVLLVHLV